MFSVANNVIDALVWTTIAGMLYAVWLQSRGADKYIFDTSAAFRQVADILKSMWVLVAISLVFTLIVVAWPQITSAAPNAATSTHASSVAPVSTQGWTDVGP